MQIKRGLHLLSDPLAKLQGRAARNVEEGLYFFCSITITQKHAKTIDETTREERETISYNIENLNIAPTTISKSIERDNGPNIQFLAAYAVERH